MPAIVPIIGMALLQMGPLTMLGNIIAYSMIASSVVTADRQRKKAARKAIDAYNASLRDQLVMVKGGVTPRQLIYGRTAVAGSIVYACTSGSKKEWLHMVIALGMGEIDAVEQLYFNDELISWDATAGAGALTPVGGRYTKGTNEPTSSQIVVPSGAPYTVVVANMVGAPTSVVSVGTVDNGDQGVSDALLSSPSDYTASGTTLTFNSSWAGKTLTVNYLGATSTTVYAFARWYPGSASQVADADLIAAAPNSEWTANHRLRGVAYLYVRLYYDESVWATGVPNIKAIVRGRKVYDPRSGLTAWTRNPALIARDYILSAQGLNVNSAKVPNSHVISAANTCDEQVQLTGTPTYQTRYLCDGVISTGANRRDNLDKICDTMAGRAWYSQGQWLLRAGAGGTPTLTLNESHLSDSEGIIISPFSSRRDLLNGAKATIIDAAKGYIENQAPEWSSPTLISNDNGQPLTGALSLPMTTDATMAQRLLKIMVLRTREAMTLRVPCNLSQFNVAAGDLISVSLARYGMSSTTMRVLERSFSPEGGVVLLLREELQSVYNWDLGEAINLPTVPNSSLPNPFNVSPPSVVSVQSGPTWARKLRDGSVSARAVINFNAPNDQAVIAGGKLIVQYRNAAQSWKFSKNVEFPGDTTQAFLDEVFIGAVYEFRCAYRNNIGVLSSWSPIVAHTVISPYGASVMGLRNLLKNSDFTDYTGTNNGAASIRSWTYYESTPSGWGTKNMGRNWGSGGDWNIGQGGMWFQDNGNEADQGQWRAVMQRVPVVAGRTYEFAFVGNVTGCKGGIVINWVNGAFSFVSQLQDLADPPAGSGYGGPSASTQGLFWVSGVAPAGAVWAEVYVFKHPRKAGHSDTVAYLFANKVRAYEVQAVGSRWFPLPWVDGGNIGGNGGGIDPGTVDTPILTPNAATEIYQTTFASQAVARWDESVPHNHWIWDRSISLNIACNAGDRLLIHVSANGSTANNNAAYCFPAVGIDVVGPGGGTPWLNAGGTGNRRRQELNQVGLGAKWGHHMSGDYNVGSAATIQVHAAAASAYWGGTGEVITFQLRVERIKR